MRRYRATLIGLVGFVIGWNLPIHLLYWAIGLFIITLLSVMLWTAPSE